MAHARVIFVIAILALATPRTLGDEPARFVERPGVAEFSGRLIVRPAREAGQARRTRAESRLAPHVIEHLEQTDEYIVRLPEGETEQSFADQLMSTRDYEYAAPDWICFPLQTIPNDPGYWQQWQHLRINTPLAWDISTGNPSVVVAIVDGGIQLDHPDLAGVLVPGYNAPTRTAQIDGGDVEDVDGHGTFVAGLAGAIGNNASHVVGVGWDLSIMPIRYYQSPGGGLLSDLLRGARWAVDNGARVVNVSQTGVDSPSVQATGAYIKDRGGLLFYAAGNDSRDLSWFDWPDVIIIGATNVDDEKPSWSAFGHAVDAFSPGDAILSTGWNYGLALGGGTSAATPIAAGIAALIWSAYPRASPQLVEQLILGGCDDLGEPGEDDEWGHGRVDAYAALTGCRADLWPPVGVLDFLDVLAFLAAYEACAADADVAPPFGVYDFADVIAYLAEFASCP